MRPFASRHIGIDGAAETAMLSAVGFDSVDELMRVAVPDGIQQEVPFTEPISERAALAELRELADRNSVRRSALGLGYHGTITPSPIRRGILENPSWYTAYTPYQPEISQGRLEALLNFQTMVADLTGLDTANASMLDEGTAVVEAMLLARRASRVKGDVFVVDADALPQTKALLRHRAEPVGITLREVDFAAGEVDFDGVFGVLVQYPGASGRIWNPAAVIERAHEAGAKAVVAADLLALALITSPGELGADIAVGSSQRFGVPMGFGGPHAGYMAVRSGLERQMPGRLVGVSVDVHGMPSYRLTLQTREQHIRREKATSNICTAQVLLAVMASMYAVYHGADGIREIATAVHEAARELAGAVKASGHTLATDEFFDTVRFAAPGRAHEIAELAKERGVLVHTPDADSVQVTVDEEWADTGVAELLAALGMVAAEPAGGFGDEHARTSEFMTHESFDMAHSETALMRYMKQLADKDYALDRGMIPLGSCTMKLNAATEMEAITWPEFAGLHPFAPLEDAAGSLELIDQLSGWLAALTGYDTVSLQPNAGSQGELAGLLAIRGWHRSRGDESRDMCLIPASAHGTNAASAVLAGMRVSVVKTDAEGNVDFDDLKAKIEQHRDVLAALMITYPSTHGVYEEQVREVCEAVHAAGGQVYIDGANLNALLGHATFGEIGGDVSHLNLHKTFCIPHGGGGPGVGPVAAKSHLAPFLPRDPREAPLSVDGVTIGEQPVSAAPFGSASILPITWAYVRMMGGSGLKSATGAAVLAANYIAARLRDHYPVLYTGEGGLVAHECILDLRPLKEATGISNDDVAKRLVDYGFHAPTMSFPVAGTLMVEPTESEDIGEIDRFIDAMIAIKEEADAVAAGTWPADDNPLVNAPHTAESVVGEWSHPYDRELAVFPERTVGARRQSQRKYWPPVGRIDQAYGDRNLVCACPPPEAFEQ